MWQGVTIWNIKDWIFSQICLGSLANTRPGPFLNYDLWKFGPFCPWKQSASMPKCGQMGRERAQFQNFRFWKWFLMVNLKLLKKCVGLNLVANIQLLIALVKKKVKQFWFKKENGGKSLYNVGLCWSMATVQVLVLPFANVRPVGGRLTQLCTYFCTFCTFWVAGSTSTMLSAHWQPHTLDPTLLPFNTFAH